MPAIKFNRRGIALAGALFVLLARPSYSHEQHHHEADSAFGNYERSEVTVSVPNVTLTDVKGQVVNLQHLLADQRPLVVQFVFTSCQTVCPILTTMTAQSQEGLRQIDTATRIISITIDPEHDTPARLSKYASQHGATGDWLFLTGSMQNIYSTITGFGATYEGKNKMNHKPYTFLRNNEGQWTLVRGLLGAQELIDEYSHALRGNRG
jgi:protein SCO1/2